MFCARCLRPAARRPLLARSYAVVNPNKVNAAKPLQSTTPGGEGPPAATSTSAAQPFSTPLTPAPAVRAVKKNAVVSGTPAGTPLKHINYIKGKQDPVALEDSEYPDWLWTLLDAGKAAGAADGEAVGDLYSKSKKERKIAKKRAEKLAAMQSLDPEIRIPISEQTIDLPFTTSSEHQFTRVVSAVGGVGENVKAESKGVAKAMRASMVEIGGDIQVSAADAVNARGEVKREMRKKSRAAIKEKNFLSTLGR